MPIICFRLMLFLKDIVGSKIGVFCSFDLPVIGANVLLEHLFNLLMSHRMLLMMVCIVYHNNVAAGPLVFNRVD